MVILASTSDGGGWPAWGGIWTEIANLHGNLLVDSQEYSVGYTFLTGAEGGNMTLPTGDYTSVLAVYRGVDPGNPINASNPTENPAVSDSRQRGSIWDRPNRTRW